MTFLETLAAIWLVMKITSMAIVALVVLAAFGYVAFMLWESH